MSEDSLIKSLMKHIASRVDDIAQNDYENANPVKVATEVIWGIMHTRGDNVTILEGVMREQAVREVRRLTQYGTSGAAEAVAKAVHTLITHGFVVRNGERLKRVANPPQIKSINNVVYHRWFNPIIKSPGVPAAFTTILYAGPGDLTLTAIVPVRGVTGSIGKLRDYGAELSYSWDIRDIEAIINFGKDLEPHARRVKEAASMRSLRGFSFPTLGDIQLSGDPLALTALACVAWHPKLPTTRDPNVLRFENVGSFLGAIQTGAEQACRL